MMTSNENINKTAVEELDVELGQLVPFAIEEFRDSKYDFYSPTSSWCMTHCKDYDPERCSLHSSLTCLGSERWRSVHEIWDTVDFVPVLLQVCSEMRMPVYVLQRVFMQIRGKTQEEACEELRKKVSWEKLVDYARGSDNPLTIRTKAEMIAIKAMSGSIAAIALDDYSMKEIVEAMYRLRRDYKDATTKGGSDLSEPGASYWLQAELNQAFECPWSSPLWNAARASNKGDFSPTFVVECPKSGMVRSARMLDKEMTGEINGVDTHFFHPWFATDLLFVIDWEPCPCKTKDDVLEAREVLALVVDLDKDTDYRLCVASLEQQEKRSFTNWVCLETLAYLGDDDMWHKG